MVAWLASVRVNTGLLGTASPHARVLLDGVEPR